MAIAIEKRLSGARGDRRRGPQWRAAGADRTVTQIGFPAPCRRRGARARARPLARPRRLAAQGSPGRAGRSGWGPLSWRDREGSAKAPRTSPAG